MVAADYSSFQVSCQNPTHVSICSDGFGIKFEWKNHTHAYMKTAVEVTYEGKPFLSDPVDHGQCTTPVIMI